ncbi:GWxTD domain-containing protein [Rhodothermus profundi]|uniref:GWxTD domain-containing protein n=1 Tax=Rhodothermus profundi TaxID=633813 RepID=A0A1M6UNZ0_9BACT|nr:GWxTD domain-containing protein [Rhodothermus profundi]SHK70880.1 GWxTD domain-containing protein [Rhodothermus profundi]
MWGLLLGLWLSAANPAVDSLEQWLQQGVALLPQHPAKAEVILQRVVQRDSGYVSPQHGAALYWLGQSRWIQRDTQAALALWERGLNLLARHGQVDVRMAEAYMRGVFIARDRTRYARGAQVYQQLLALLDQPLDDATYQLLEPHLTALSWILPPAMRARPAVAAVLTGQPASGAGSLLLAWWRSQDPLPATRRNERLEEHLERVGYALTHFVDPDKGFDDRARIYVRLGPPWRRVRLSVSSPWLRRKVFARMPTLMEIQFPRGEFWVYRHINGDAQYVFVSRDNQPYRLGTSFDLLPSWLLTGIGATTRGQEKARAAIRILAELYGQLATNHPLFGLRYQDLATYAVWLDELELAEETANWVRLRTQVTDLPDELDPETQRRLNMAEMMGVPIMGGVRYPGLGLADEQPHQFALRMIQEGKLEEEEAIMRREEQVPRVYSNLFEEVEPLPVSVRLARFLDPDGTTRTRLYWSASNKALQPGKQAQKRLKETGMVGADFLVTTTLAQRDEAYRTRTLHVRRQQVWQEDLYAEGIVDPVLLEARGDTGLYHLVLQISQFALDRTTQPPRPGPLLKITSIRFDSLHALNSDPATLEMSDLLPLWYDPSVSDTLPGLPYPFPRLNQEVPLALYFEIYHLTFGTNDRTRYEVSYEVRRRTDGGLLRRDRTVQTTSRTVYEGTSRTAREYIVLDLQEWKRVRSVEVVVRVRDLVSGQEVARTIRFEITTS